MTRKNTTIWLCENCGNEFSTWSGKCSVCGEWNTLKEIKYQISDIKNGGKEKVSFEKISEIESKDTERISTGIGEFDRVLGGGVMPGSIILLGGEPGIGKSTLLLQIASNIGETYYLSAEESIAQIKNRADRLKIKDDSLYLASENDLESTINEIRKHKPKLIIIDSIQTVFLPSYPSTAGSLVQVRECGMFLQQFAKRSGIPIILIGHVTKDGSLAGPMILEHLVDAVLYLEGERYHDARILRGVKNRFGATNEVGIFSLQERGMIEIKNPSELFLSERQTSSGSIVTATLEGMRPILIEVQALVTPTNFGYPKRTTSGFDLNRLNLLAAVISKKTLINLSNCDIYINVVGGMKLNEPAVDLAICSAIISSYKNKPLTENLCVFGEVGLSGEVRKVSRQKDREKEAQNLGFSVLPATRDLKDLIDILKI